MQFEELSAVTRIAKGDDLGLQARTGRLGSHAEGELIGRRMDVVTVAMEA